MIYDIQLPGIKKRIYYIKLKRFDAASLKPVIGMVSPRAKNREPRTKQMKRDRIEPKTDKKSKFRGKIFLKL